MQDEGVIKFSHSHEERELRAGPHAELAKRLASWRQVMARTELVGQVEHRYGGAGFGNLSGRLNPPSLPQGRRRFLITGTQTGGVRILDCRDFCVVESYSLRSNRVQSWGPILPSSEAMTHAAIYDLSPHIRFVFHGHSPTIWRRRRRLRLPTTNEAIAYGTAEMAYEVQRLYRSSALSERRVLAMGGHEDGIIAFGHTAKEAGLALVAELAHAFELSAS